MYSTHFLYCLITLIVLKDVLRPTFYFKKVGGGEDTHLDKDTP